MKKTLSRLVTVYLLWACLENVVRGDALWAVVAGVGFVASLVNIVLERKGY